MVARLLAWYRADRRVLPWRGEADPYRIWVSEVMLQQTRAEAVASNYERFLARFPDVRALASASREEVLATWAGLGYYRRAHMLHDAARQIVDRHQGRWPRDFAAILRLPGVGDYTAAAVASIAFDQPRAALDGNAVRVLARLSNEGRPVRLAPARSALKSIAESMAAAVPVGRRGAFTQALMELGATVCVPRAPRCDGCPWALDCRGLAAGTAADLPSKRARKPPRNVEVSVAIVRRADRVLVRQRGSDAAIMPGFWELPTVEGPLAALSRAGNLSLAGIRCLGGFSHAITDTRHACRVYEGRVGREPGGAYRWIDLDRLQRLPLTTISRKALRLASGRRGASGPG